MSEINRVVEQLRRAKEGEAWHGPSLDEVLAGVNAAKAAAKPPAGGHSIWELVHHLGAWAEFVRRRIEGEVILIPQDDPRDWPAVTDKSNSAWQATLSRLNANYARLLETVAKLSDARLNNKTPGKDDTLYEQIHGTVQHTLYHAGQIALLKKL
jgi:uncharacterized damage-inducible protein DinB